MSRYTRNLRKPDWVWFAFVVAVGLAIVTMPLWAGPTILDIGDLR